MFMFIFLLCIRLFSY